MEMSIRTKMVLGMLMIVGMVVASDAQLSCSVVYAKVVPCLPYLKQGSSATSPASGCCDGIKALKGQASTPADRKQVCICLKSAAGSTSIDVGRAARLPSECGVAIPYKISPSTDCSKVN